MRTQQSQVFLIGFIITIIFSQTLFLYAEQPKDKGLQKSNSTMDTTVSAWRMIDVNDIYMWIGNNGLFAADPISGYSGAYYLSNLNSLYSYPIIYSSGLMIAAKKGDSLCSMVCHFWSDASPGAIDQNGNPYGRYDESFRVYKIGKADSLINSQDYSQWPSELGAPVDTWGNPLHKGDQTLWCCFTDGYPVPIGHKESHSAPLGAEIHMTVWAWENINNMIFLQWEISNKSTVTWEDAYVGFFSDPDYGFPGDDLIGSDSSLSLVYCYNAVDIDVWGDQTGIPALGYVFTQPPIIPSVGDTTFNGEDWIEGFANLPVKSPLIFKHDHDWGESFNSPQSIYNRLKGLDYNGNSMNNPFSGEITDWAFTGDPVTGTGWLDPQADDRRMMLSSGPFDLNPGESQTVALSVVIGPGKDRLNSITKLKEQAPIASGLYKYDGVLKVFDCPADLIQGSVTIPIHLYNPVIEFESLTFTVSVDTNLIKLNNTITPSQRLQGLNIQSNLIESGRLQINITSQNSKIKKNGGLLLTVQGSLKSKFGITSEVKIVGATGLKSDNLVPVPLSTLSGLIRMTSFPQPVSLLAPANLMEIDQTEMTFSWTSSFDADYDSLIYHFYWVGDEKSYFSTSDTTFFFNGSHFFQGDSIYQWTVTVDDGIIEQASADTFSLIVPDIDQLSQIPLVNQIHFLPDGWDIYDMKLDNDNLYILCTNIWSETIKKKYYVFNVSDPQFPKFTGKFHIPDSLALSQLVIHEDIAYCTAYTTGHPSTLRLLDLNDCQSIEFIKYPPINYGSLLRKIIYKDLLLIFYYNWGGDILLDIYNISGSNKANPILEKTMDWYIDPYHIMIKDSLIYYIFNEPNRHKSTIASFSTYQFDDNFNLTQLNSIQLNKRSRDFTIIRDYAYILSTVVNYWGNTKTSSFSIIDISNPSSLSIHSEKEIPSGNLIGMVNENYFYTSNNIQLDLFNIQDPAMPIQTGFTRKIQTPFIVNGQWIYAQWRDYQYSNASSLRVLNIENISDEPIQEISNTEIVCHQNYPNPFVNTTVITLTSSVTQNIKIDIFNVLGRHIVKLKEKTFDPGTLFISWNGLDKNNSPCAAGLYLCRIQAGDKSHVIKMIKF